MEYREPELEPLKLVVGEKVKFFHGKVKEICLKCPESKKVEIATGFKEAKCDHWYATCVYFRDAVRKAPVSKPYFVTGKQHMLGKPYCGKYDPDELVEVIDIFYVPVSKKKIDRYVNHIVDRLRNLRRKISDFEKAMPVFRVREFEDIRRELHAVVASDAGFEPFETSKEACAFKDALEGYVEQRVFKFGVI